MKGRLMRSSLICAASLAVVAGVVACSDGSGGIGVAAGGSSGLGTAGTAPSAAGTSTDPTAGTGVGVGGSAGTSTTTGGTTATTGGGSTGGSTTGGSTTGGSTTGGSTTGGSAGAGGSGTGDGLKHGAFKMLVLSTTLDFHHTSIPACNTMLNALGMASAPERATIAGLAADATWTVDQIDPAPTATLSEMSAANLAKYDMVYSNNPTGHVFTQAPDGANKKIVFQNYMDNGGAWAGQHSATDFENNNSWTWFDDHVAGGWFVDHNGDTKTPGTVAWLPAFSEHPILKGLASPWNTGDEWYVMNRDIAAVPGFKILAQVTTTGTMNNPNATVRPAIWITENAKGGRTFYTIRGHEDSVYAEPEFRQLMLRGILWSVHRLPGGN
jgi:type 1 glutamine amidotransferase